MRNTMHVEKTLVQYYSGSSEAESDLTIKVDFDPSKNIVREIISVKVFSHRRLVITDITAIMVEQFDKQMESIIASIDWKEIARLAA